MSKETTEAGSNDQLLSSIADKLRRYPNIEETEVVEVARFIRDGPFLEFGRLGAMDDVSPKLQLFRQHEKRRLGLQPIDMLKVTAFAVLIALTIWLLWDAGIPG